VVLVFVLLWGLVSGLIGLPGIRLSVVLSAFVWSVFSASVSMSAVLPRVCLVLGLVSSLGSGLTMVEVASRLWSSARTMSAVSMASCLGSVEEFECRWLGLAAVVRQREELGCLFVVTDGEVVSASVPVLLRGELFRDWWRALL